MSLTMRGPFIVVSETPTCHGPLSSTMNLRQGATYDPPALYGACIEVVAEDAEGRLWAFCDDEACATQINFCPFTGRRATRALGE